MERYFVFMADLGKPLHGENPRGGKVEDFNDLAAAQLLAQAEKDNWDLVLVCERGERGVFYKVERYQKGRKYVSESQ